MTWHGAVAVSLSLVLDRPSSGSTKHLEFQHVSPFSLPSFARVRTGHLLGIVLYVGNYLNGGTPRGRADGFALDTLVLMRTVKMWLGKVLALEISYPMAPWMPWLRSQGDKAGTLVDYITGQMELVYPGDLHRVFAPGGCAAATCCQHLYQNDYQNDYQNNWKQLVSCWEPNHGNYVFLKDLRRFVGKIFHIPY